MLTILDYDAGNIESVRLALRHVGGEAVFARDADEAAGATRIVFPGVGSAAQCMANLKARGFDALLRNAVAEGTPTLAICIGMQLLFEFSEEDGGVPALGILPGTVRLFKPDSAETKVPHMGWNDTTITRPHPLLSIPQGKPDAFYFVHSYYVDPAWDRDGDYHGVDGSPAVYGTTEYAGGPFTAIAGRGSLLAAQFHPEKSGPAGLDILRRFLAWDGSIC